MSLPVTVSFSPDWDETVSELRQLARAKFLHALVGLGLITVVTGGPLLLIDLGAAVAWVVSMLFWIAFMVFSFVRHPRKLWNLWTRGGVKRFVFSADGIEGSDDEETAFLRWSAVHKCEQSKTHLSFERRSGSLILVPKRAFRSPEDLETVRELIERSVPHD